MAKQLIIDKNFMQKRAQKIPPAMKDILDKVVVYRLVDRLITPFNKWPAFKMGIIDKDGNILRSIDTLTPEERREWGTFDVTCANIKRLMHTLPGGEGKMQTIDRAARLLSEEAAVNNVGGGKVAGAGVGPDGEPGVKKKKKSVIAMPMLRRTNLMRGKKS